MEIKNNKEDIIKNLSSQCVNLMWGPPLAVSSIDHSCREYIHVNIAVLLQVKEIETINDLTKDESLLRHLEYLNNDTMRRFWNYYCRFGGKSALFALCMQRAFYKEPHGHVGQAMWNFLNWYHEDRQMELNHLSADKGVSAWFPFELFMDFFVNIAAGMIGTGIIYISKEFIWPKVRENFYPVLQEMRTQFSHDYTKIKPKKMGVREFKRVLKETGLMDDYLYVIDAEEKYLDEVLRRWTDEFCLILSELSRDEIQLLETVLSGVVHLTTKEAVQKHDSLREKGLIWIIEPKPQEVYAVIYSNLLNKRWPPELSDLRR